MISDVNILGPLSVFLKTNLSPNNPKVQVALIFLAKVLRKSPFSLLITIVHQSQAYVLFWDYFGVYFQLAHLVS